jgi:DNA topoisomerase-3
VRQKRLYIAEKPLVAAALIEALGGRDPSAGKTAGYTVLKNGDEVLALAGHVLGLAPPSYYFEGGNRFFDAAVLPIMPEKWIKLPAPETDPKTRRPIMREGKPVPSRALMTALARMKHADIIVHACDIDREGQLIGDEVILYGGLNPLGGSKAVERLPILALDEFSLSKLLAKPKRLNREPIFANLGVAGICRERADWKVGMNYSRGHSIAAQAKIPVGRVRTPVANMVLQRTLEIENFTPHDFYVPEAKVDGGQFLLRWRERVEGADTSDLDSEGRIISKSSALAISERVKTNGLRLTKCDRTKKAKKPPLPFDMPSIRSELGRKMKCTAKQMDKLADTLYVKYKLITYIGTDCRYLPVDQHQEAGRILNVIRNLGYPGFEHVDQSRISPAWNDKKVNAKSHHAIIPTGVNPDSIAEMKPQERELFNYIARRYMSQFMPDYTYESLQIHGVNGPDLFTTLCVKSVDLGWHISEGTQPVVGKGVDETDDEAENEA